MNAYEMFQEVRDNIGESTAAHWTDLAILRKLNAAQRKTYQLISQTVGDWFVKKATLTPVASIITLPADCAKPVYLEKVSNGSEIPINVTVRERRQSRLTGFDLGGVAQDAYLLEGTIEVNQEGFTDQVNLWYERRLPNLHFGTAAAGAAASLTLEDSKEASLQNDYYNGVVLEAVDGTGSGTRDTISDYTGSTRVCVVTGTYSTDTVYGTESILPREADDLLVIDATVALLARPSSALDPKYFEYFYTQLKRTRNDFEEWCSVRLKNSVRMRITEEAGG
jgi:hypothetical protein